MGTKKKNNMLSKEELKKHKQKHDEYARAYWSKDELSLIKQLFDNGITNSKYIMSQNWFPNRSMRAIENKIKELRRGENWDLKK